MQTTFCLWFLHIKPLFIFFNFFLWVHQFDSIIFLAKDNMMKNNQGWRPGISETRCFRLQPWETDTCGLTVSQRFLPPHKLTAAGFLSVWQIKKAYRQKALTCHPDKNPDNPKAGKLPMEVFPTTCIHSLCIRKGRKGPSSRWRDAGMAVSVLNHSSPKTKWEHYRKPFKPNIIDFRMCFAWKI